MKIAIVIGSLDRGGSERQVVEFVRATHPRHAECVVICLGAEGVLAPRVRETGARVLAMGIDRPRSAREVYALARRLRRERPDVVYAFLFWGYTLALPLAALVAPGALRVAARRSLPGADVPRRRAFTALRVLADASAHAVIANSVAVHDAWCARAPRLRERLHVVPNGIELPADGPGAQRAAGAPVSIVCVANLIHYKGHDVLVEAAARIGGDRPWRLSLVGEGPQRSSIERAVERLGLGDRVRLLGLRADVDAILRDADIAVLASRTEGLPNAVMEAMARGLPVVATDVGGVAELLGSGAGTIVAVDDPDALARALRALVEAPDLRRRQGEEGRRVIGERFSLEAMRDRTLAVIDAERRARA